LVTLVLALLSWAVFFQVPRFVALVGNSQDATGMIEQIDPQDHQDVHVRYALGGDQYSLVYSYGGDVSALAFGQTVRVYYLPADPAFATQLPPRDALLGAITESLLLGVITSLVVSYWVVAWRGWWQRARSLGK
jgi:hypothetical protein